MYVFQLRQKDHFRILSIFHILISLILFFDFWHAGNVGMKSEIFSIVFLTGAVFLLAMGIFSKKIIRKFSSHISLLILESILLSGTGIYFWSIGVSLVAAAHILIAGTILFACLYFNRRKEGEKIIISEQSIVIPGIFIPRIILWSELTNLIKKDDVLTIDFKNNKLIQAEIINANDIDEKAFNQFCIQQLSAKNN